MSDALRTAAQAVLDRWSRPTWQWASHGPTADLMHALRTALAQPEQPAALSQPGQDALDAARYRRIRNGPYSDQYGDLYTMTFQGDGDVAVKGDELDRVVDAAIAKGEQP